MRDAHRVPLWVAGLAAGLMVMSGGALAAWSVELPYFAFSAGPVGDVIEAVQVVGEIETYPSDGEFYMLTVSLQEVNAYEAIAAGFDPTVDLIPASVIRGREESDEDFRNRGLIAMDTSKEAAVAVAMDRLGMSNVVTSDGVRVAQLLDGSPAAGRLEVGDVIVAVEGEPVTLSDDLREVVGRHQPGDWVELTVLRGGEETSVRVRLTESEDEPGRPLIGILAETVNPRFPVQIDSANIGGPSAGMMYALGIIELLTEDDLAKGHVIAGTGTLAADGSVGPIGGVRQKVVAAEAAGAEYVLVPQANYEKAVTADVSRIQIVPVATIDDALDFLRGLPPA